MNSAPSRPRATPERSPPVLADAEAQCGQRAADGEVEPHAHGRPYPAALHGEHEQGRAPEGGAQCRSWSATTLRSATSKGPGAARDGGSLRRRHPQTRRARAQRGSRPASAARPVPPRPAPGGRPPFRRAGGLHAGARSEARSAAPPARSPDAPPARPATRCRARPPLPPLVLWHRRSRDTLRPRCARRIVQTGPFRGPV
jgi:hypothetical protein